MAQHSQEPISSIDAAMVDLVDRGLDPSVPGLRTAVWLVADVATNGFGLQTTQLDVDHYVMAQGVVRRVDDLVDEEGISAHDLLSILETASGGVAVDGFLNAPEARIFESTLDAMQEDRRLKQLEVLSAWPDFEAQKRGATTLGEYKEAIRLESQYYSMLSDPLVPAVPDGFKDARLRASLWLRKLFLAGYAADYAADMPTDYDNGRCQIPPTLGARLRILGMGIPSLVAATGSLPPHSLPRAFTLVERYGLNSPRANLNN